LSEFAFLNPTSVPHIEIPMTLERYRGCLVGLACGDAVGTTVEFHRPGSFKPVEDMLGGGPFRLEPGQWTDDTSMALCLAESLLEKNGFDPVDQMQRYVKWRLTGHLSSNGRSFDIGNTVLDALIQFEETGEPSCGSTDPYSAGNGSLMRLAPVPLFFARDPLRAVQMSADSSRTTHGAATAVDACRYYSGLIVGALQGLDKETILASHFAPPGVNWHEQPLVSEIDEIARAVRSRPRTRRRSAAAAMLSARSKPRSGRFITRTTSVTAA